MSGDLPKIGIILMILGLIAGLCDHVNSEIKGKEIDDFIEAQAILLADKNIGNLYTEAGKRGLNKGERKTAVERFEKALKIDPNDDEALISLAGVYQWTNGIYYSREAGWPLL